MAYVIPPWLQPVSPVQPFLSGVSQGADIAGQQNRMELAIQEMTLRREAQQRHDEAQQLAAARTVQDMAEQQQVMAQKAREAALKWEWNRELTGRIQAGEDPMKAWEATAPKYNPAAAGQYFRQKQEQDRLTKYNQEQLAISKQRADAYEQSLGLKQTPAEKEQDWKNREMFRHDYGAWKTEYNKAVAAEAENKRKLDALEGKRMTASLDAAGDQILKSQRDSLKKAMQEARMAKDALEDEGRKRGLLTGDSSVPIPAKKVVRTTKDGRKAVFDADTHKFLEYAD